MGANLYELAANGAVRIQWRRAQGRRSAEKGEGRSRPAPKSGRHLRRIDLEAAPQGLELLDRVRDDPANGQPVAFRAWPQPSPRRPSPLPPVAGRKLQRSSRTAIADMLSRPAYVAAAVSVAQVVLRIVSNISCARMAPPKCSSSR